MSNEEIVARIQSGEKELIAELWDRVERLIRWKANHVMLEWEGYGGVEFWDLVNSGYFALLKAAESFNPESGAFSTWLVYHLKNAFAEAMGGRSKRQRYDPLNTAFSLDSPLTDDEDGGQFSDVTQDPAGAALIESVDERIWREQLHEAMEKALNGIPPAYSKTLRLRYYDQKTLSEVAELQGVSVEEVRNKELRGLRKLRHAYVLRPFFEPDFYCSSGGAGLQSYRRTGMSIQERHVMMEEERRKRAIEREQERRDWENSAWEALVQKLEEDEIGRLEK